MMPYYEGKNAKQWFEEFTKMKDAFIELALAHDEATKAWHARQQREAEETHTYFAIEKPNGGLIHTSPDPDVVRDAIPYYGDDYQAVTWKETDPKPITFSKEEEVNGN